MAVPADERGVEAARLSQLTATLRPLVHEVEVDAIAANIDLLAGSTLVARTAEDVFLDVRELMTASPEQQVQRRLERLQPEFEFAWVGDRQLTAVGNVGNPLRLAADVLAHAREFPALAVGVNSARGTWAVVVRTPERITVVEGGSKHTMYRTYDTSRLLNPLGVLTDQELAVRARISTPPFTRPGDVDREVLDQLSVTNVPLGSVG
jgi:hypothetical protein